VTRAGVADPADVDWYRVRTSTTNPGNLLVTVWGLEAGGLDPTLDVYDGTLHPLAARVLSNDDGMYTVQLPDAAANSNYYVRLAATDSAGSHSTGNYFLALDFRPDLIGTPEYASGTLTAAAPQAVETLTVYESQLFHFTLSALTADPAGTAGVRLSVRDSSGREVFTLFAA